MDTLAQKVKGLDFRAARLAESISEALSQAILHDVPKGGDQLAEVNLEEQLGTIRSPLREDFGDAEKRGPGVIVPVKGT